MQRTSILIAAAMLVAGASAGCGSGGGGSANDGGIPPGSGTLTWREGGMAYSAIGPAAARVLNSSLDMVQISGGAAGGAAAVALSVSTAPPLAPGAYACSDSGTGGRIVTISYLAGTATSSGVPTCAIDLTSIGDATGSRVTGTFTATLDVGGATKSITDGAFDLALTVSSL